MRWGYSMGTVGEGQFHADIDELAGIGVEFYDLGASNSELLSYGIEGIATVYDVGLSHGA